MRLLNRVQNLGTNDRIVFKNVIYAAVVKGGSLIISFLTTPAFIKYFNNDEVLGVWYTVLSVLIWFLNFDLGIGNGIRNSLTKAFTNGNRENARKVISSGLFANFVLTAFLSVVGFTLISFVNLNNLFGISESVISHDVLYQSVILIFIAIMLRFFLVTVTSIFYSMQRSAINNFLSLLVSILQFAYVTFFHFSNAEQGLLAISKAYMIISNLPVACAGIILFLTVLKDCRPSIRYIEKKSIKGVMGIGGVFFACQLMYMLIVNTNEFIITNLFGPKQTTIYSFYYKITSIISIAVTLALTPIWSVVTKAREQNDWNWIRRLLKIFKVGGLAVIVIQFLLIPFLPFLFDVWLGKGTVETKLLTSLAFSCFGSAFVYSGMLSTIVCGMARMKLQSICYAIGIVFKAIFIFASVKLGFGWDCVVWSNAILLAVYCLAQQIDLDRFVKKQIN